MFNLRGNQRTAGERSRKEGGKVFGSGSRNTVAIFLLVRTAGHEGSATVRYRDIGDYLTSEEKLQIVGDASLGAIPWREIAPNRHGDWINQRDEDYLTYPILGDRKRTEPPSVPSVFTLYSLGVATGRDAWAYNFGSAALARNAENGISEYNRQVAAIGGTDATPAMDKSKFSWNENARADLRRGRRYTYSPDHIQLSLYRPFTKSNLYFDSSLNARRYQLPNIFPTSKHANFGFYLTGIASHHEFSLFGTRLVPDLHTLDSGQFFPRYRWELLPDGELDLGLDGDIVDGYRRIDNITDEFHALMRERYGQDITKDDVFFFLYGLLHSPEYRERYAGELKQMLPRIPEVSAATFRAFTSAGRELFGLHADYEEAELYPLEVVGGERPPMGGEEDYYRVQKMRFPAGSKAADAPESLVMNAQLTVTGIPQAAYRYQLGSRSAIEWIIRQYQVTTDKASGIVNDPNLWGIEHGNPRYILDLLQKVISVSVRTVEITEALPALGSEGAAS